MNARRWITVVLFVGLVLTGGSGIQGVHARSTPGGSLSSTNVTNAFVPCNVADLIAAIHAANATAGSDTLDLAAGCTYTLTAVDNTFNGANGLPVVTTPIVIEGHGAIILRDAAAPQFRLLAVDSLGDLELRQLILTGGSVDGEGGAILNGQGALTVVESQLHTNTATGNGGAIGNQEGTVYVGNSSVEDNTSGGLGGGLFSESGVVEVWGTLVAGNDAADSGGGLSNRRGTLTVDLSSVRDNRSEGWGGGIATLRPPAVTHLYEINVTNNWAAEDGGGLYVLAAELTMDGSVVNDNSAYDEGGGLGALQGQVTITNSTLSDNYASLVGGGIHTGSSTVNVHHSTIAGNLAGGGGGGSGIYALSGTVNLRNTIVADHYSGDCSGAGAITSLGHNLDSDGTCVTAGVNGDLTAAPLLGPLQYNGGNTYTRALLPGSPALDQGSCQAPGPVAVDQRGISRPIDLPAIANADDGCDIGAYEFDAPHLTVSPSAVYAVQDVDEVTHHDLILGNDGGSPLGFLLHEVGPLEKGLDLYLPLDEPYNVATFADISGNGNDGSCVSPACPVSGVPGHLGNALEFNGWEDRVETPLDIDQSSSSPGLTMMAWVYPTSTSSGRHQVLSTDDGGMDWSIMHEGGYWYVYTGEGIRSTGQGVALSTWQHVAAAYDPALGQVRFYKDGLEVLFPYIGYDYADNPLMIGENPGPWNEFFAGRIDEVRVYDRALLQSEVEDIYLSAGVPWLSAAPSAAAIPVGGTVPVQVTLDSTGLAPGAYGAQIVMQSNDPNNPVQYIPAGIIAGLPWNDVPCDIEHLIAAVHVANTNPGPDTLELASGCTYILTEMDNETDGSNGLPSITSELTVHGNGATIDGTSSLRIFHVAESGNLALDRLTLRWSSVLNRGTLSIENSTLRDDFYGLRNVGTLTLVNSTLSETELYNEGSAILSHSTIVNTLRGIHSEGTLRMRNTIVAVPWSRWAWVACDGEPVISEGHNLDSDGTCGLSAVGDLSHVDPLLGPLQDNGGPTETHALQSGSPALDRGSCPDVAADQRGTGRPLDLPAIANAADGCDIGAVEADWPMVYPSPEHVYAMLEIGATGVRELGIGNAGPAPLDFELLQLPAPALDVDLWLRLDEAPGATTFDDLSENANDGSCTGAACPVSGVPGHLGNALEFDGVEDRVETLLDIDQSSWSPGLTMMAWVYPTRTSSGRHQVLSTDDGGMDWSIMHEGGYWYVYTGEGIRSTGQSVDLSTWQYVAAAYDPALGQVRFYKDGLEVLFPYIGYDYADNPLMIGENPGPWNEFFAGRIDEVHVYPRALDAAEVERIYREGSGLSWLSRDPISGTVPAYSSTPVELALDATGLAPGAYRTRIAVQSSDPTRRLLYVPVDLFAGVAWDEVGCQVDHLLAALDLANSEVGPGAGPNTLELAPGCTYALTRVNNVTEGPNGLPVVTSPITINGHGATIERGALDWNDPLFRIAYVAESGELALTDLVLRGGELLGGDDPKNCWGEYGGGILNHGTLSLDGSTVTESGGNCVEGGGIYNADSGTATVANSTVSNNWNGILLGSGGIHNRGTMTLIDTRVQGNSVGSYGSAGGIDNEGILTLISSTVSDNRADDGSGGGIVNRDTLTLINSTVSGNMAYDYGAGLYNSGTAELINSTITDNSGVAGPTEAIWNSGSVSLTNTIVANQAQGTDCGGDPITSLGHNLDSDGTCGLGAPGDLPNTDPLLGPLQDNGGPTWTHELLPGSPAIDAGDDAACPAADQRGVARPQDGDEDGSAICDVGAFEREAPYLTETQPVDPGNAPPVDFPTVGFTLDCSSGPGGLVTVTRYEGDYPGAPGGVNTMIGYWEISTTGFTGPYVCDLIFHYDEDDLNGAAEGEIAGAARWDGGHLMWGYFGGALDTGADTITIPDVSDFSTWLILTSTPPQAVSSLGGTRSGSDLTLSWPAVTEDILGSPLTPDHYRVYRRAGEPYFVPAPADIIATPATPVYTDPGVLGDPAFNYYYVVTAVDGAGVESAGTKRLGAFNYELVPAAGPGERAYNLIALPLEVPPVSDADTLAAYAGPGVYMVLRHDAPTQEIQWRLPGLAGTNFVPGLGEAPYLYLDETAGDSVSVIGTVSPIFGVGFNLARPDPGGSCTYNFISLPLYRDDLADADALAADIGGVYSVSRYNAATQDLTWRLPGVSGENFPLRVGYPYIVCLDETAPARWP